jgi:hypothetical protein
MYEAAMYLHARESELHVRADNEQCTAKDPPPPRQNPSGDGTARMKPQMRLGKAHLPGTRCKSSQTIQREVKVIVQLFLRRMFLGFAP